MDRQHRSGINCSLKGGSRQTEYIRSLARNGREKRGGEQEGEDLDGQQFYRIRLSECN